MGDRELTVVDLARLQSVLRPAYRAKVPAAEWAERESLLAEIERISHPGVSRYLPRPLRLWVLRWRVRRLWRLSLRPLKRLRSELLRGRVP